MMPTTLIQSCGSPGYPEMSSIAGKRWLRNAAWKYCGGRKT